MVLGFKDTFFSRLSCYKGARPNDPAHLVLCFNIQFALLIVLELLFSNFMVTSYFFVKSLQQTSANDKVK